MDDIEKICNIARSFSLMEGENKTEIPFLSIYRSTDRKIDMPQLESFYIYVVLDGSIRLYTPSGIMDYLAGQYSISKIDTSNSGYVLTFSDKGDFLALAIELTLNDVISVLLDIDGDFAEKIAAAKLDNGTMTSSDTLVVSSIARLFPIMKEPAHRAFMEKHIKKEIIFYILCGSCGSQFLQSIINIQQAGEIYEINSWIKENFRHSFTVEELAEKRNMSVSLFHQKFKSAVGMGPLQCQKRLRLTEARRLMLDENQNVTEASMEVGYESVSQFTRDYRKMFGMNPKEDIPGTRKLPMSEDVFRCFQAIIEDREAPRYERVMDGYTGFLFTDKEGLPLVAMHWEHRFNHMVKRYNDIYRVQMPNITPHVCRHTYCSNMAKSGMNPKTLQYLMGHSDIGVTLNTYTHLGLEDAVDELKRVEELENARKEMEKINGEGTVSQKMFRAI